MAIKKGAVVIDTKLDNQKITSDFKNLEKQTQSLINKYNKSVDSIKSQELAITKVKNKLDELTSGNKTPTSIKNLETELKKAEKEVSNLQQKYDDVVAQMENKNVELDWANNIGDKNKVYNIQIEQADLDTKSIDLATKLETARDRAEQLKKSLEEAKLNPNSSLEVQELNSRLDIMNSKLSQTKTVAIQTKEQIEEAFSKRTFNLGGIKSGIEEVSSKLDKFKNRVTGLIASAMIFNLISSSATNLRNNFTSLLKTNDTFNSSLNQIKANLMTAFAPIYNAVLPAINTLMNALSKLTGTIAMFVANLFGVSLKDATNQAKKLSGALEETSNSGEKAQGSLSGLDEIENLNVDTSSSSGSSGATGNTGIDYSGELEYSSKLLDILNGIKDFVSNNSGVIMGFLGGVAAGILAIKFGLSGIKALGIGVAVAGIIMTIEGIISYLNDPSWENFGSIISGIGLIIAGVAIAFGAWPVAVAGALVAILGLIISNWDKIKETLQNGIEWLKEKGREIFVGLFGETFAPLYDGFVSSLQTVLDFFDTTFTNMKNILDNIIEFVKNVFAGNWEGAWENIKNIFSTLINQIKETFLTVFKVLSNIVVSVAKTVGNVISDAFKAIVNAVLSAIENILNFPINTVNKLIGVINKVPGINLGTLPTFDLPRLATGAVIPPRQEFAAILGDQRHGTNIEAPLDTIVDAFNIALNNRNDSNNLSTLISLLVDLNRNVLEMADRPVEMNINGKKFAQATYKDYENEGKRRNSSTAINRT